MSLLLIFKTLELMQLELLEIQDQLTEREFDELYGNISNVLDQIEALSKTVVPKEKRSEYYGFKG